MIRYPDALTDMETAIEAESKNWLVQASERTEFFRARETYLEEYKDDAGETKKLPPFWGDIKPVYMRRQFRKCIYCEKKLEGRNFATVEWDLEHFRPKSRVKAWPPAKRKLKYDFPTGVAAETGYYLLSYHPRNYAAACKTCNSPFKSDHFPIGAHRIAGKDQPEDYADELPFLVYPLGTSDENPETLLRFDGVWAVPRHTKTSNETAWRRGQVMIDFFGLNRDGLLDDRAWWLLMAVWPNVLLADKEDPDGVANLIIARSEKSPFTNCARCFLELCHTNRPIAEAKISEFRERVNTMESNTG